MTSTERTHTVVMDYLNAIEDETWERVCGAQDRKEFAELTIDWGEDAHIALSEVRAAWEAAVAHADAAL